MKTIMIITLAAAGMLLSSCNTFIGFGRDLQIGGEAMQNAANKAHGGSSSNSSSNSSSTDSSGAPVY
jgi:predicted small secreted protein